MGNCILSRGKGWLSTDWTNVTLPYTAVSDGFFYVNINPSREGWYLYLAIKRSNQSDVLFCNSGQAGNQRSSIIPLSKGDTISIKEHSGEGTPAYKFKQIN